MPLITCPDCRHEISDAATACIHCGRPKDKRLPEGAGAVPAPPVEEYGRTEREPLVYPTDAPRAPVAMALLSLLLPGLGQVVAGQTVKGFAVLGGSVALAFLTSGFLMLIVWPIISVDAYQVASKLARGEPVPQWAFFPR